MLRYAWTNPILEVNVTSNPDLKKAATALTRCKPYLLPARESIGLQLLRACTLRPYCRVGGDTDVTQAGWLQKQLRHQFYRLMRQSPDERLRYSYQMNCPPVGLRMRPQSRICNHPVACPWCYIRRRAQPAYAALIDVPAAVRDTQRVVLWRQAFLLESRDTFFPANQGPHQWCDAALTIQMGVPAIDDNNTITMRLTGIQLVGRNVDVKSTLTARANLNFKEYPDAADTTIFESVVQACAYDWRVPLAEANLATFHTLAHYHNTHAKTRLYRVSKYKPQGDLNGHQQPTVSEEQHQPSDALSLFD